MKITVGSWQSGYKATTQKFRSTEFIQAAALNYSSIASKIKCDYKKKDTAGSA
jgi:hypothetical protein